MTAKELADLLNGRTYRDEITPQEEAQAKAHGLVVVFGASDDLLAFHGAISDEVGAHGEGSDGVRVLKRGALLESWDSIDSFDEAVCERYFEDKRSGYRTIKAVFTSNTPPWEINTDIPHHTFNIMDEGEPFCVGLIFALADL